MDMVSKKKKKGEEEEEEKGAHLVYLLGNATREAYNILR
jgi:hypothetical protein